MVLVNCILSEHSSFLKSQYSGGARIHNESSFCSLKRVFVIYSARNILPKMSKECLKERSCTFMHLFISSLKERVYTIKGYPNLKKLHFSKIGPFRNLPNLHNGLWVNKTFFCFTFLKKADWQLLQLQLQLTKQELKGYFN